jgi:phytoene dehydrogenase-like protein
VAAFPAAAVARSVFRGPRARALFAGLAAHGTLPLERSPSAGFGLVLAACAHADGWPLVRGGSQALADALVALLRAAGGTLNVGCRVDSLDQLRDAAAAVLDVSPRELLRLAGGHARRRIRTRLAGFRYGCGVHKVEWALSGPVPWRAGECAEAGTVHLGGGLEEISAALRAANAGRAVERPFVLFGQPTQFDESRAPPGGHNAWAYCAVPAGTDADYTTHIEAQVERYAPGFRELIVARHVLTAQALEAHNGNLVGGSLAGAVQSLPAFFLGPFRFLRSPYRTPMRGVYLCSAVTPPGPGVHGMFGWHAAHRVLRDLGRKADGLFSDFGPSIL